jgi:malate dehydrogenase (oxaloacetate-decarboxylating)
VARFNFPADVRFKMAEDIIRASREDVQQKMREGVIVDPDK